MHDREGADQPMPPEQVLLSEGKVSWSWNGTEGARTDRRAYMKSVEDHFSS